MKTCIPDISTFHGNRFHWTETNAITHTIDEPADGQVRELLDDTPVFM